MKALERLGNIKTQVGLSVKQFAFKDYDEVDRALKRAEKVEELLEVYKGIDGGGSPEGLNKLYKLRDKLEEELK